MLGPFILSRGQRALWERERLQVIWCMSIVRCDMFIMQGFSLSLSRRASLFERYHNTFKYFAITAVVSILLTSTLAHHQKAHRSMCLELICLLTHFLQIYPYLYYTEKGEIRHRYLLRRLEPQMEAEDSHYDAVE